MNAVFLKRPDGVETDISICGECGSPARGRTNFDLSQKCCTCWECGGALTAEGKKQRRSYHDQCERDRRARIDAARMENATLVDKYDGPVYCEGVPGGSYGDGYFSDIGELADMLDDGDVDESVTREEFAYCCKSRATVLDIDSALENLTEEMFDDAMDHLNGLDALMAAVEAFNEANKDLLTWDVDYSRKVRIPKQDSVG